MAEANLPRGGVPPGTYSRGGRSPIVYALLCAPCAGYAPTTDPDYDWIPGVSGRCQGCGANSREVHRFQALIMSAANGGCMCVTGHPQVTGDLPTEASALAVWSEVKTRPKPRLAEAEAVRRCNACAFPASCSEDGRCVLENPRGGEDD